VVRKHVAAATLLSRLLGATAVELEATGGVCVAAMGFLRVAGVQ